MTSLWRAVMYSFYILHFNLTPLPFRILATLHESSFQTTGISESGF